MNMKNIIITGATRGLGLSIANKLAIDGYNVIATGRKVTNNLNDLIHDDTIAGSIKFYPYDFKDLSGIKRFADLIIKENGRPYGLINNAALGHDGILGTMHESQIKELINVNLAAPIIFTKYISRSMLVAGNGRVINISSIIGSTGFNGLSVYGATKSGLNGFTKSLSRELGKAGITVNNIAPGYMDTDMTKGIDDSKLNSIIRRSPMKKLASLEDVSAAIIFLLKEEAKSITGSTITIDAGSTA